VRISIVGAGPAGLYFAILMKKADPRHEIVVVERNAPDATFGWGVVFSEETLGALRDADYQSYVRITEAFARWNTVDIRYQGTLIRSRGHVFSGISRQLLLNILQQRALELDVDLRFHSEVDELEELEQADLVVAADGVNSALRDRHAGEMEVNLEEVGSKFVWFGSDLVFDAFTFIFRETEYGLFQVHAYPYDAVTSTFIVECPEETWRKAGLDAMSEEESIAFCEDLFADELAGHRLMSNRSLWTSFMKVRCASWHEGKLVLLGDSAHTAHFSIGSGTKLAMEDSIALSNAFQRHPDSLEAALVDYELERQPVVERFQEAADQSARYFEEVGNYAGFDPIQFAFNLLTRSGRISYANLMIRDPRLVRVLDSWFAGSPNGDRANGGLRIAPPPMFSSLEVGSLRLRNRVVRSPTGEDATPTGAPGERDGERLVEVALTGPALVITGLTAVSPEGRVTAQTPMLLDDEHEQAWRCIVERVHDAGSLIGMQLGHAGRRGATRPRTEGRDLPLRERAWPLLSASPLPYAPLSAVPDEMNAGDMQNVCTAFADAAKRAMAAGFDAIELNFAHGYLLASFVSPLTNRRDDEYGGALENRLRFPLEVLDAVRSACPDERLVAVRMSASDWAPGGLTLPDAVAAARAFASHGAGLVHVCAGQTVVEDRPSYRRAFLTRLSDRIRAEGRVRTLVGGYVTTDDEINTIVGAGRADLCILEAD
jgi:anthraniloyl-CoA monooxygenase